MYLAPSMQPLPRDDRGGRGGGGGGGGGRLSDRISGFAAGEGGVLPAAPGLPAKPTPAALDQALSAGGNGGSNGRRNTGTGRNGGSVGGPPPPPPPDAKEDPRAVAGRRVSYHDMDLVAEVRFVFACVRVSGADWIVPFLRVMWSCRINSRLKCI